MCSVYILFSADLDKYYIGCSADPVDRLRKHLSNNGEFTSKARDWVICYIETFETKSEALKREKQLKNWKNRDRLKRLIDRGGNSLLSRLEDPEV